MVTVRHTGGEKSAVVLADHISAQTSGFWRMDVSARARRFMLEQERPLVGGRGGRESRARLRDRHASTF